MKAPQFTLTLAKALQNSEIPVTYELLSFKGESAGLMPVLGESKIGQPTGFEHFPIFDEDYRKILVGKIVDRYYGYEIGTESADMFWNALRRWLNANMPFYNELYRKIPFDDAFLTVDIKSESESVGEGTSNSSSEGTSNSSTSGKSAGKAFENQMPQTGMTEGEYYATSATENAGESATSGNSTEKGKTETGNKSSDKNTSQTKGFQGNRNAMLADFRANIINTDDLIVTAMRPLFMLIWKNTETATTTEYMRGLL